MVDGYLNTNKTIEIQRGVWGRITLKVKNNDKKDEKYMINETAEDIISFIGKKVTLSEMINELANKYKENIEVVRDYVFEFFETLEDSFGIKVYSTPDYISSEKIQTFEEGNIYPRGVMIEITSNCNYKCLHCYGGFEACHSVMSYDSFTKLIDQLESLGVTSVELTGGEITTHPKLLEMIKYVLKSGISKISLLTNGSLLSDEVLKLIEKNTDRIIVQIDLHGLTDEYLEWFMGIPYSVEKNKNIIKRVANLTDLFRVATVVTRRNLNQIEAIADWLHENGIKQYGLSLVIPEGRALECNESDLFLNNDEIYEFNNILNRINDKYPSFITIIDSYQDRANCGCLSNCFSITSDGRIKMCAMDSGDTLAIPLGNALNENIKEIYDKYQGFIEEISHIQAPSTEDEDCKSCENFSYCSKCLFRAFSVNSRSNALCGWAEKLPEQVRMFIKTKRGNNK